MLGRNRAVLLLELLEHRWVVDVVLDHVIHDVGHLLQRHVVLVRVVAMVDILYSKGRWVRQANRQSQL